MSLEEGARITLTARECEGGAERVFQKRVGASPAMSSRARVSSSTTGSSGLFVERVEGDDIVCTVENAGVLGQRKSVNVRGCRCPCLR